MSEIVTTVNKLLAAQPVLDRLSASRDLSNQAASHVRKLRRLSRQELEFYVEKRDELIKRLGETRDPTPAEIQRGVTEPVQEITPVSPNWREFTEAMEPILEVSVTIAWKPLRLDEFGQVRVTGDEQDALGALLLDESDAETVPKPAE